jgi:hypothetical protein
MDRRMEAHEIHAVEARLAERFPMLDVAVVEAAVRLAHSELTGGIRTFVPLLVEHNARDRLAAIADREPTDALDGR